MKTPIRDILLVIFILMMFAGQFLPKKEDEIGLVGALLLIGALGMIGTALVKLGKGDFKKKEKEEIDPE